jgi:hypothetical protein
MTPGAKLTDKVADSACEKIVCERSTDSSTGSSNQEIALIIMVVGRAKRR